MTEHPSTYFKISLVSSVFLFFLLINLDGYSQLQKYAHKVSPALLMNKDSMNNRNRHFRIATPGELPDLLKHQRFDARKLYSHKAFALYMINTNLQTLQDTILRLTNVLFVEDGERIAKDEGQVNDLDLSANKINVVHRKYPQYNGDGLTVSIKENKPDTADIDIAGRYVPSVIASPIVSSHATNMATMVAGAGNSWHLGKGAAWASLITSSDYASLLPDPNSIIQQLNISVQNHSYGVGIENFYAPDAVAYDSRSIANPTLIDVFSSGNNGTSTSNTGPYAGIPGFANLSGSFKMAKNIITVGGVDSFGNISPLSSRGPAHDGRVKPELVAFGLGGTSGSAALTSGVSLMLQHQYKLLKGSLLPNALVKAILLNSADDVGNKEVDYSCGFGNLNAFNAVKTIQSSRYVNGSVTNGSLQTFSVTLPAGLKKFKVTLVWNDPPGNINASKALVNDIDLEIKNAGTNQTWLPWVLNKSAHQDSLKQLAVRKRDSLNNVEQVTIDFPAAGNYELRVKGYSVTASQNFYIAYQFDSVEVFEWHFPMSHDAVFSATKNTLRWNSSYTSVTGRLEYSIDNGSTWQLINAAVDLGLNYYNWLTPAVIRPALLRMSIGTNAFVSDTFVIASRTQTGVGFNCPDSFLFYWNKLPTVDLYRLYKLGNRYLEPVSITSDSFAVLKKNLHSSRYYAVAPVVGGREGLKSYTINYTIQGVECYIRYFLAAQVNNSAVLDFSLGTTYNITRIVLEKYDGQFFKPIQQITNINGLIFSFTDNDLVKGLNLYRIKLELAGGGIVYSQAENIFHFLHTNYVIYPNPVYQYTNIQVAQQNVNDAKMLVYNSLGQKVFEKILDDRINIIPAGKLSKGVYFLRFVSNDGSIETGKLVVY